jgi:hypothetical protein
MGPAAACKFCGEPLKLLENAISARCMACGECGRTRTWCKAGHFVCEGCRGGEMMELPTKLLERPWPTDPIEMFLAMRASHDFPMHGPSHHPLAAAALLLPYHRLYDEPAWPDILDVLQSAATGLPGGAGVSGGPAPRVWQWAWRSV